MTNSLDPQLPFTIELASDVNTPNPLSVLTNPRLAMLIAPLQPLFDTARNYIADQSNRRLQPKAVALAQRMAPAIAGPLMSSGFNVPVVPSLNL